MSAPITDAELEEMESLRPMTALGLTFYGVGVDRFDRLLAEVRRLRGECYRLVEENLRQKADLENNEKYMGLYEQRCRELSEQIAPLRRCVEAARLVRACVATNRKWLTEEEYARPLVQHTIELDEAIAALDGDK